MFSQLFWKDAGERMASTAAQVMLTIISVYLPGIAITNGQDIDVAVNLMAQTAPIILLSGVGGAFYALLKAVIAAQKAGTDTASLTVDNKPLNTEAK